MLLDIAASVADAIIKMHSTHRLTGKRWVLKSASMTIQRMAKAPDGRRRSLLGQHAPNGFSQVFRHELGDVAVGTDAAHVVFVGRT